MSKMYNVHTWLSNRRKSHENVSDINFKQTYMRKYVIEYHNNRKQLFCTLTSYKTPHIRRWAAERCDVLHQVPLYLICRGSTTMIKFNMIKVLWCLCFYIQNSHSIFLIPSREWKGYCNVCKKQRITSK